MIAPIRRKVFKTEEFREWQAALRDDLTKATIDARIKRLQFGLTGDVKPVGGGVSELRIKLGPGWRVYYHETKAGELVLLLNGGDKGTQDDDIKKAKRILRELKDKQAEAKAKAEVKAKAEAAAAKSKGDKR